VSVLLIRRGQRGWRGDVLIGLILVMTMVKPTVSLPFFWLVLFCKGGVRPVVVAGTAYVALTLLSAWFQPIPFATLLAQWIANSQGAARFGYANVSAWCTALGLERLSLPASFSLLIMLGVWTYRYRHADVWILLGVAALVARLWTHHLGYDDVVIVIPLAASFRLARGERYGGDVVAGALIAITSVVMLTPESVRHARAPWPLLFSLEHTLVWIPLLLLLLARAPHTAPAAYGVRLTLPSSPRARTAD